MNKELLKKIGCQENDIYKILDWFEIRGLCIFYEPLIYDCQVVGYEINMYSFLSPDPTPIMCDNKYEGLTKMINIASEIYEKSICN